MRHEIILYINGKRHTLGPEQAFMTVSDYVRYTQNLRGTKVVCAEGDCGACTILVSRFVEDELTSYYAVNSCIGFMYLYDRCHLITVEGLKVNQATHPVQTSMVEHQGAQCGYCTPGFICAMASLVEDSKKEAFPLTDQKVKNYLTGNLCRCTGYDSIIKSALAVQPDQIPFLRDFYQDEKIEIDFKALPPLSAVFSFRDQKVYFPSNKQEALKTKKESNEARVNSGSTDLGVLHNKGKLKLNEILVLNQISELYQISDNEDSLFVGAKATLSQLEKACVKTFPAFSDYLHVFASPQIKNAATLVGNVVNASPISDTTPFLKVAEAELILESVQGKRIVNINSFFKGGYKELDLNKNELVTGIRLPKTTDQFKLYKVSTRRDLDISTVTFAARYRFEDGVFKSFSLALGGVGATVLRMTAIEKQFLGQKPELSLFKSAASSLNQIIKPLSDVRGSADYRILLCQNLLLRFYDEFRVENHLHFKEASV